ncbi:MAG: MATE family efflux transporter [Cellvibrionaceae bacterium]
MGAQLGMMLMGVVDTMMVGRLDLDSSALAASSIANAWLFAILWFGMGIVQGIDPLITQAHGAKRQDHALIAMQRGLVLSCAISIPLILSISFAEEILLLFQQDPKLASMAQKYLRVQLWSVPFFLFFVALRQYLQGREIVKPMLWVSIIANVFNVLANYILIYGKLGFPALGLEGAGIATSFTRCFMFFALLVWGLKSKVIPRNWFPYSKKIYQLKEFVLIIQLGLPVGLQIGFEILAFSCSTFIAGMLGQTVLAAHTIALNIAALAFMMPLGISQGAVTRVGNLLGDHQFKQAKHAAWTAIFFGGLVMTFSAFIFVIFRFALPLLYTDNKDVILITATILPVAAAFQIVDGIQVVGAGVLRGMGRPLPSAIANLVAFWLIGLPIAYWTTITLGYGIEALWWSLSLGLAIVAISLSLWIFYRGPEKHSRHFE